MVVDMNIYVLSIMFRFEMRNDGTVGNAIGELMECDGMEQQQQQPISSINLRCPRNENDEKLSRLVHLCC